MGTTGRKMSEKAFPRRFSFGEIFVEYRNFSGRGSYF